MASSDKPSRRGKHRARRSVKPVGAAPGTLIIDASWPAPRIDVIGYGPDESWTGADLKVSDLAALKGKWPVLWVNVSGLGDEAVLRQIAREFGLHRLALEDVVTVHQRAKLEPFGNQLFMVARMMDVAGMTSEQLSLFLIDGVVLTFQERLGDCFDRIRERISHGQGIVRSSGADYLAYALLDSTIDSYFPILESIGLLLSDLEDEVLENPEKSTAEKIHETKRELIALRRNIWPHRELLSGLDREASGLLQPETRVHIRDVYDHTIQIIDLVESYREVSSDLMGLYLSSVSNRMNEVMKVLTIFATIFMPLGFIAGVYGMNFDPGVSRWNMPELGWTFGYPFALGLMAGSAGLLLYVLWRKGWLG
ncbi:MAG: magnesium/cobalt transporter CorA [Gammaproteobacteria bacterium]|nr:magnesium/cobalt transporter CorA [Gammaproteobacteria bacterium]MDH4254513.1 magnesium/cobalt transporter CorA [Gammaproteobacteria bacterium]MDH5309589.1 magnesium/cobalt transporter CorA [Gammaproteobacteria bacterium]